MIGLYVVAWGGFVIGSLVLGVLLVVAAVRLLLGWRPHPPREWVAPVVTGSAGAAVLGLAFGTWMWFGFPSDDASRGVTAAPPLVFGALAVAAAAGFATADRRARRTGAGERPERLRPT